MRDQANDHASCLGSPDPANGRQTPCYSESSAFPRTTSRSCGYYSRLFALSLARSSRSGRECLSLVREHLGVGESAVVVGVPRFRGHLSAGDRRTASPTRPSSGCAGPTNGRASIASCSQSRRGHPARNPSPRVLGQQKGSKRSKSSLRNRAQIRRLKPVEPHQ